MKKILTDVNIIALISIIVIVFLIFIIFPEKNNKNDKNGKNNKNNNKRELNDKILKETENENIKTTILKNERKTQILDQDIYLMPKLANNNQNEKNKQNKKDFKITNIKVLDENLEERNILNYNELINLVFDYSFPKGMYYFSLTLDIDDNENIDINPQKDVIRNYSGSTLNNPLTFKLERNYDTESILIKNIIIKVYKVFGKELPDYVYEHPTNLTFEIKKDKDLEEKELEENKTPDIIQTPSYGKDNEETQLNNTNEANKLEPNIIPTPAISYNNNIQKVQTQNNKHNVAENSEMIDNEESECAKINKVLQDIDVNMSNKNDILKLESILPSLQLCAMDDINAKKYLEFYYKEKEILNEREMRDLNPGNNKNNVNEKILLGLDNELNPNNENLDKKENSTLSFVDLTDLTNNQKMSEKTNEEQQELDRNLKLQSNQKMADNNLLNLKPLNDNIEKKGRINAINNALIESF